MTIDPDPDPDSDPSDQRLDIRPSPIAGRWYSSSPKVLSQEIDTYLEAGSTTFDAAVVGLIAPHAGYLYSGKTAGQAFAAVKGTTWDLVVVLSPLHAYHSAPVLTSAHAAYTTPLGTVPVDRAALEALRIGLNDQGISLPEIANDSEHSLEIELPFLQRALAGAFSLLPIMVRSHDLRLLKKLASALAAVLQDRGALLVGSTDLSHFYPQKIAQRYDREMLQQIEAFSPEGVLNAEQHQTGFACGAGAVAVLLWAAKQLGADRVQVLDYSTSADQTGDSSSVVGYGAAAILKNK